MAKPHKYAWNGIDVETTLTFEQLANMAQRAAQESTGDLMHGKFRIASVRSSDRQIEFRINDFLITYKKCLVFFLDFETRSGRTWMSSRIDWYVTTQSTVGGFIPVGSKTMVAHRTYMQFVHNLAGQVRLADPQARITIREGVAVTGAAASPPSMSGGSAGSPAQLAQPAAQHAGVAPAVIGVPAPVSAAPLPPPPPTGFFQALRPPPPPPGVAPLPPQGRAPAAHPSPAVPQPPTGSMVGLVTSVPGMPQRTEPVEPPSEVVSRGYASIAEQLFAEDEGLFHTRLVQQTNAALPWSVCLPDGSERLLQGALVLGRNPSIPPGSGAVQVSVTDPDRSVSKTHALLEVRDGLPWVTDLHSTNGTTLTNDIGEALVCDPGAAVPVGDGWVVGLGQCELRIVRRATSRRS